MRVNSSCSTCPSFRICRSLRIQQAYSRSLPYFSHVLFTYSRPSPILEYFSLFEKIILAHKQPVQLRKTSLIWQRVYICCNLRMERTFDWWWGLRKWGNGKMGKWENGEIGKWESVAVRQLDSGGIKQFSSPVVFNT